MSETEFGELAAKRPMARVVRVPGTSNAAGKSWVTTAFCRWYASPGLRMKPLLPKPERDTHSQVALLGQVHWELTAVGWRSPVGLA